MKPVSHRAAGSRLLNTSFGSKIRGINAVPKSTHPGFTLDEYLWMAWDWTGWVKKQVDVSVALGANCLKLTGCNAAYMHFPASRSAILSQLRQYVEYCAGLNVMVYEGGAAPSLYSSDPAGYIAALVAKAQVLDQYSNVVGMDLCNEINTGTAALKFYPNNSPAAASSFMSKAVPAVRAVSSLPLTASITLNTKAMLSDTWVQAVAPWCDFIDYHPYFNINQVTLAEITAADITPLRSNSWWKPFLIGESGQAVSTSASRMTSTYQANGGISALPDCMGAIAFCTTDYEATFKWGMTDSSFATRSAVTTPFQSWPAWR